jgi:hypothetical protein
MKKLTLLLIVLSTFFSISNSFAQSFIVNAGFNLSNMLLKDDYENFSDQDKMKPGFQVGATMQIPANGMFSFETGLVFINKGAKSKYEETFVNEQYSYKGVINLYYIKVPLLAKATFDVGSILIFGELGPYLGIGLFGNIKSKFTYQGETNTDNQEIIWGTDANNDELKRLDYGLTFGAGILIKKKIQVGLSYDLGLANISSYTEDGSTIKNRAINITVGYRLGKK